MVDHSNQKTLREWVLTNAARPVYLAIFFMLAIQLLFVASKIQTNRSELRESAVSLSNVMSVGLFQKNRLLIETSAAFALSSSEIKQICILEGSRITYSAPLIGEGGCEPQSTLLFDKMQLQLQNLPQYEVRLIFPKYPGFSGIAFLLAVSALVTISIFFVLFSMLKKIEVVLINPLMESISKLDVLDRESQSRKYFEIVELNKLIRSYHSKMIEVKELTDKEAAMSKDAAIGRITAQLSHDMRAPLGTFERLLLTPSEKFPDMKPSITDSLNRIYAMIDSLRFGEAESIVKRCTARLSFSFGCAMLKPQADERNISLQVPQDGLFAINLDHSKVERAWMNLTSNALEFAKSSVSVEAELNQGDLIIRVIDDGPGVPDEFQPKLFERGATHGGHNGSGLGLAYVRQIMRGHGGEVVYIRQGGLTVFECRLPDAIQNERESMERVDLIDSKSVDMPQKVAICLEPKSLSEAVTSALTLQKTEKFFFFCGVDDADIVVSNIDSIMFDVLERDRQEFIQVSSNWGDEAGIIQRLKLKFSL